MDMQNALFFRLPRIIYYIISIAVSINHKKRSSEKFGYYLYKLLLIGGPFYIKLGQIMSTRSDLLSPETIKHLQKLQDDTPANDINYIRSIVELTYSKPIEDIFDEFCEIPIASASIAQVHKAKLKSGETVAIKIIRKNARNHMLRSLKLASFTINVLQGIFSSLKRVHASRKMDEVRRLLTEQLYFDIELHNMKLLRENFHNHKYVSIPKPFEEYCRQNILVMEYIDGIKALDYHKVEISPKTLAARLQDTLYTMVYFDGVCHGDPHPGNIIFSREGKITFLDFGIVAYLTEYEKWGLSSFFYAATSHSWELAVKRFTSCFVISDSDISNDAAYIDAITKVFKHHFRNEANAWNTAEFLRDVNHVLTDFDACYASNFTKAELALMSCEGFATQIDPDLDVWGNARAFVDRFSPFVSRSVKEIFDTWYTQNCPSGKRLRDRAKLSLIASTHLDRYFLPSLYPVFVKDAQGAEIIDIDGNRLLDLSCGYGPHILGYNHPVIQRALIKASSMININALGHEYEVKMAEKLISAFPGSDLAVLSNSGTESVIHAVRLCRAYRPNAKKIAKFEGHYHGFSDQAMISSWFRVHGEKHNPEPIAGCQGTPDSIVKNTRVLQFNHEYSLEVLKREADDIACVLVEPVRAGSGNIEHEYLREIRNLCSERDIPLVFDEVVTGFRVDYGGAQTLCGVIPDLTCLGKIIGGGLPAGAVVGKERFLTLGRTTGDPFRDYEERAFLGGTMSGNYISCTTGLAMLNYLDSNRNIYQSLKTKTDYLSDSLLNVASRQNIELHLTSGYTMFSLNFTHKKPKYFREGIHGANFKATLALAYFMRMNNIYMPELHGFMISDAHNINHLDRVIDSFDCCLHKMNTYDMFSC
jgi:glutamate-1-semialdehyde 2,1-aminomutase